MADARETRTRNSHEKYLAASWYDIRTSFSRELTRTSFSHEFLVRVSWALVIPSCYMSVLLNYLICSRECQYVLLSILSLSDLGHILKIGVWYTPNL